MDADLRRARLERDAHRFASGCFFCGLLCACGMNLATDVWARGLLLGTLSWTLAGILAGFSPEFIAPRTATATPETEGADDHV